MADHYDPRDEYCTCGDPVVPGKRACVGCLLDQEERESLEAGEGPIVQLIQIEKDRR
jgi:hypothetical protein